MKDRDDDGSLSVAPVAVFALSLKDAALRNSDLGSIGVAFAEDDMVSIPESEPEPAPDIPTGVIITPWASSVTPLLLPAPLRVTAGFDAAEDDISFYRPRYGFFCLRTEQHLLRHCGMTFLVDPME